MQVVIKESLISIALWFKITVMGNKSNHDVIDERTSIFGRTAY